MGKQVEATAEFVEWEGRFHVRLIAPGGRRRFARESFATLGEAEEAFRNWLAEHGAVAKAENWDD